VQGDERFGRALRTLASHLAAALAARRMADLRKQQPQIVVGFVAVPTVDRLDRLVFLPVTAMAGGMPSIRSASGFSSRCRNCRV